MARTMLAGYPKKLSEAEGTIWGVCLPARAISNIKRVYICTFIFAQKQGTFNQLLFETGLTYNELKYHLGYLVYRELMIKFKIGDKTYYRLTKWGNFPMDIFDPESPYFQ
jgi:predicted transcriptional regulator